MSDVGSIYCTIRVDDSKCDYCMECVQLCPTEALTYDKCFNHDKTKCTYCEVCSDVCEHMAITILEGVNYERMQ